MLKTEVLEEIQLYMQKNMDDKRYEHSLRVADTAKILCIQYGENPEAGYFAGLVHDLCKQFSDEKIKTLAKQDGLAISHIEKKKPSLLHGRAGAVLLEEEFFSKEFFRKSATVLLDYKDAILEAVRFHTFGEEKLSVLAKIVYIADKIEPGRSYEAKSLLEEIQVLELDDLALKVIQDAIAYLERKKKEVALSTLRFYEELLSNRVADYDD